MKNSSFQPAGAKAAGSITAAIIEQQRMIEGNIEAMWKVLSALTFILPDETKQHVAALVREVADRVQTEAQQDDHETDRVVLLHEENHLRFFLSSPIFPDSYDDNE